MSLDPQVRMLQLMRDVKPAMRLAAGEDFAAWQKKARAFLHLCQIRHYKRDPISAEPTLFSIYSWIDDRIKAEIRRIMKRNENK